MPTRKQRRRAEKGRRHEYETVWVDDEGNELEEPPEEAAVSTRERRDDGKAKPKSRQQQSGRRALREPPVPSWSRAAKRSALLGVAVFLFFYLLSGKGSGNRLPTAFGIAALYVLLFIPFTYYIDRMTRRRWEKGQSTRKR